VSKSWSHWVGLIVCFIGLCGLVGTLQAKTYGYVENVSIENQFVLPAKLDTGAKSVSIDVQDVKIFRDKQGKSQVSFVIENQGKEVRFVRPLIRYAQIKSRVGEGSKAYMKRPVVMLRFGFDGQSKKLLVNLTNRDQFNYPVLFGRNALKAFNIRVDPSKRYTVGQ
jgi:hypothetical protein